MTMPDEESMTGQQRREHFKEWEEDHHAARVRDYGAADAATYGQRVMEGAMMPPAAETPHPWPSDIARENQRKATAQEQGKNGGNENGKDAAGYSM
jgi:hypothetical protein